MSEALKVMTGVGRIIQGHPMILNGKVDFHTKKPKIDEKTGQQKVGSYTALAFPKSEPEFARDVYPMIMAAAQRDWPSAPWTNPRTDFAWKWFDADDQTQVDKNGKPYGQRPHFAGCYILKLDSSFLYKVCDEQGRDIADPRMIKCGDYARAYISIKGNGSQANPGLYINVDFMQRCGFGDEIRGEVDVSGVLAQVGQFRMPPGASMQPTAPTSIPSPGIPQPGMPAPGPTYAPPTMPAAAPQVMAPGGAYISPPQPAAAPMQPAMPQVGTVQHGNGAPTLPVYAPHPGIMQPPR